MAWNGSDGAAKPQKSVKKTKPSAFRGLLAAIIVIGCAAGLFLHLVCSSPINDGKKDEIKVKPIAEALSSSQKPETAISSDSATRNSQQKTKLDYARLAAEGKTVITNRFGEEIVLARSRRRDRPRPKYAIFEHESENKIAALLTVEPGTKLFGTQIYDEKFIDDFLRSCEEPIIVAESDDDFTKQLKQDLIETKVDLRNRMNDGEDLREIMAETRKELQRLGIVKHQVEQMMREEAMRNVNSEIDIDDYFNAANIMLEANGISPIKMTPILKHSLMRTVSEMNSTQEN